ncbi:MAG: hypothetical protein ABEJ90_01740 [Halobacterium sp.]
MTDEGREGFDEGVSRSSGDQKVLFALNAVLSTLFALFVVWGMAFVGFLEFTLVNVASLAIVLFSVTYLVTS